MENTNKTKVTLTKVKNGVVKGAKVAFKGEFALFWVFLAVFLIFTILQPKFASWSNLMNILKNASILALMVAGMTWVITANEMDCSFPDIAAFASMIFALCVFSNISVGLSLIIALIGGMLCGGITSLLVVKFNFNSLITTIAVATIAKSLANAVNGGQYLTAAGIKQSWIYTVANATVGDIPVIFLIVVLLYVGLFFIQEKTKFGQYIFALGENRQGIKEAGVKTGKILSIVFIISAMFAALAGVVAVLIIYGSGQPSMGSSYFLDGFTVVFLGAMVLKLGKTNVVGTLLGAVILAMITNGLSMLGSSYATGQIIKGVLLVAGIVVVTFSERKKRGKAGILKFE